MPTQAVKVINSVGLHATPLAQFVTLARSFPDTEVCVRHGEKTANGKGLIAMLALEALHGAVIEIETTGPDAERALAELTALVASGFAGQGEKRDG